MRHTFALTLIALLLLIPAASWAEFQDAEPETHWSLGTDAAPWFLSGYSVIAGVEPAFCPGCRVQVEVWGFDFPEFYVDPWVAAGPVWTLSPEPEVAGERYEESPVQILGTLHVGWRF